MGQGERLRRRAGRRRSEAVVGTLVDAAVLALLWLLVGWQAAAGFAAARWLLYDLLRRLRADGDEREDFALERAREQSAT